MGMQILDSIKALFKDKADGMTYSNGQLQLKSGSDNVGGPISINTEGGLNAFVSGVTDYTFKASVDTNNFKLFNYNQSMRTTITKEGLMLVRGKDYSVGNDGTVTLIGITIKANEEVDVTIYNTSMEYTEIMNRPDLSLKADKVHTHSYAPSGYGLGTTCITIADIHTVTANGWYMGANVANAPTTDWWMYEVKVHNALWIEVIATPFNIAEPEKGKRIKYKSNGTWTAWKDPFGAVVSGKQEVVTAINDSLGYTSGLTTNDTFSTYAWWIQNKVAPSQALSFIPNFFENFSSVAALNAAVPLSKGIEAFLSLGTIPQVKTISLSPMTGDIIFFNGNLSGGTYGTTHWGRMWGTQPFTIAFYWTDRYGNQVIETLYNTTFVERVFFYKFNAFYILNPLKGTITTDHMNLSTATGQSSIFSITI